MNKAEFLEELEHKLRKLPKEDIEDAISYYTELLDDMNISDTDDVVSRIGTPDDVAEKILSQILDKAVVTHESDERTTKTDSRLVKAGIIALCTFPVSLPVVLMAMALIIVFVVVAFTIVVTIGATGVGLVAACLGLIWNFIRTSGSHALMSIGLSVSSLGLGVLFIILTGFFAKWFIRLGAFITAKFVKNRRKNA